MVFPVLTRDQHVVGVVLTQITDRRRPRPLRFLTRHLEVHADNARSEVVTSRVGIPAWAMYVRDTSAERLSTGSNDQKRFAPSSSSRRSGTAVDLRAYALFFA